MSNSSLSNARKQKNDEFYTLYEDVEKEIHREEYLNFLKDKIVYCNCDDPSFSNFWKYFHINFSKIGLKRLIATFYSDMSYKMEYNGGDDDNIEAGTKTNLQGNGDFRSEECIDILKKVDVVITNPPFSLFREYISQLVEYEKKFLIIGNSNAITYKEIFPLIKENKMWFGVTMVGCQQSVFLVPKYRIDTNTKERMCDGKMQYSTIINTATWFTNLEHNKRHDFLTLYKQYNNDEYPKYDGYDAINVDKISDIPIDYDGVMGVPISFIGKYCPEQFDIIGLDRYTVPCEFLVGGRVAINGVPKYARILIRKKQEKKKNYALIQGDCLEVMKHIPSASVDMILCDLPYGTTACSWDTIIPFDKLWEQYNRIIKPNGAIVLFASMPFTASLTNSNINNFSHHLIWQKPQGSNFLLSNKMPLKVHEDILIFYKNNDIGLHQNLRQYFYEEKLKSGLSNKQINQLLGYSTKGSGMAGHYFKKDKQQFSIPKEKDYLKLQETGYFQKSYTDILTLYYSQSGYKRTYNPQYTNGKPYTLKSGHQKLNSYLGTDNISGCITENTGKRYPISILHFNKDKDKLHPTQKPVALLEYLIKTYSNEGDLVLDNCMGSGSTGVACLNTNRRFLGIELDEKYFNIAKERIEKIL